MVFPIILYYDFNDVGPMPSFIGNPKKYYSIFFEIAIVCFAVISEDGLIYGAFVIIRRFYNAI